jgi:hypothetical protein
MSDAMLQFFGIEGEWLGWPICGVHLHQFKVGQAQEIKAQGAVVVARETRTEEGAAQLGHKRRRSEPKGEGEEQEQKRKGKKRDRKQKALTPLDHVPLQPIGLFESCFLERHGTPRQGLLVPSSRGKLTLRR